jgi:hypothetical protein
MPNLVLPAAHPQDTLLCLHSHHSSHLPCHHHLRLKIYVSLKKKKKKKTESSMVDFLILLVSGLKSGSSVDKPKSSGGGESSSGSFGRKVEFSSSFDKYKGSPSRIDSGGTSMTRRWSRNSDHSSINMVRTD